MRHPLPPGCRGLHASRALYLNLGAKVLVSRVAFRPELNQPRAYIVHRVLAEP
jgi:hypothetical protein